MNKNEKKYVNDIFALKRELDKYNQNLKDELNKNKKDYLNQINILKRDLDKSKNENQKLRDELNKNKQNYLNEINTLKKELDKYKNDNQKLKDELTKSNKIISNIQNNQNNQNNQINNNELKNLRDEIINLKNQLNLKNNEIKEIKNNINIKEETKYNIKDIIVITFNSSEVNYGIKCLADETFAEVEEKLYKIYDNLRETNNMFTVNAKPILRFKKIKENNIKDGDIIQLFKLE